MPYIIFLQFSPPALTRSLKAEKKKVGFLMAAQCNESARTKKLLCLFFVSGSKVSWFENVKACLSTESSIHLYIRRSLQGLRRRRGA